MAFWSKVRTQATLILSARSNHLVYSHTYRTMKIQVKTLFLYLLCVCDHRGRYHIRIGETLGLDETLLTRSFLYDQQKRKGGGPSELCLIH